jgi:citrate lyase subunit alpha/citrate CoA-transferase
MPDFELKDIPYINRMSAVHGLFDPNDKALIKDERTLFDKQREHNKVLPSLEDAIEHVGLRDGMTISFHHHFRNGDYVVNMVMETIAKMGFRDLTLAASSLNEIHEPLIRHIQNGVVTHIETSGMRGKLADAVSEGLMDFPVIFRSHGGRAAAIETGELHIDVAFLGAPTSDPYGNANGYSRESEDGGTSCGSMGYAKIDAMYADKCVIITDSIVPV